MVYIRGTVGVQSGYRGTMRMRRRSRMEEEE